MLVRAARADDLLGAAEARVASWRTAFAGLVPQDFLDGMDAQATAAAWAESLAAGRSRIHVAVVDDRVVGYAGTGPERDPNAPARTGELYALYVHPSSWGVGAGRALTDTALADLRGAGCTAAWLWVLKGNTRGRGFYARYGFSETTDRTYSSLGDLPEIRLSIAL